MSNPENLQELSKKLLGRYIKGATNDVSYHSFIAGGSARPNNPQKGETLKHDKKAMSRQKGIEKATDKLTKEDMEMTNSRQIVEHLYNGDLDRMRDTFAEGMREHIASTLETKKLEVAHSLTGTNVNEENLDEAKLIQTHSASNGNYHAKVYGKNEDGEHVVKFHENGKHLKDADYHTNDLSDANGTAKAEIGRYEKKNIKEDNLQELSSGTLNSYLKRSHKNLEINKRVQDHLSKERTEKGPVRHAPENFEKDVNRRVKNRTAGIERGTDKIIAKVNKRYGK